MEGPLYDEKEFVLYKAILSCSYQVVVYCVYRRIFYQHFFDYTHCGHPYNISLTTLIAGIPLGRYFSIPIYPTKDEVYHKPGLHYHLVLYRGRVRDSLENWVIPS